jgi:hypothetical protein
MPHQQDSRTDPTPDAAATPGSLTDEQVSRLADMIADGRCPLPPDLPPANAGRLLRATKSRLRDGLVRLMARAIARDLRRATGQPTETLGHA